MELRAVPAERLLAPLAVLVPIGATPILVLWLLGQGPAATGPALALLALTGGLVAVAVAGRANDGALVAIYTAFLTWAVVLLALPVWYSIDIDTSACGKTLSTTWEWLPPTGGALVFLAVGWWGVRTHRNFTMVPLAGPLGVLVLLLLVAAVPGIQGTCET